MAHVRHGDVVFHYDASQSAIAGWSTAQTRATKSVAPWRTESGVRQIDVWDVPLRDFTPLPAPVSTSRIAAVQYDLFPALRDLEDRAGELYYPFEMGPPDDTRPLDGFVFKLPAVFVAGFPELVAAVVRRQDDRPVRMAIPIPRRPAGAHATPR